MKDICIIPETVHMLLRTDLCPDSLPLQIVSGEKPSGTYDIKRFRKNSGMT